MRHTDNMRVRCNTPWGIADTRTSYGPGVTFYSTPSHGGFQLSDARLLQVQSVHGPVKTFCGQANWFEEDCDWAYVATALPELFSEQELVHAKATLEWLKARKEAA